MLSLDSHLKPKTALVSRSDDAGKSSTVLHDLDAADAREAPRFGRIFPRQRRPKLLGLSVPAEEVAPPEPQLLHEVAHFKT